MHASEDIDGNVNIFWGGQLYYSFNRNNLFEKTLGIALLTDFIFHKQMIY